MTKKKMGFVEAFEKIFLAIFPTIRHYFLFIFMIAFIFIMRSNVSDKYIVLIASIGGIYCLNEFTKGKES